MLELLAPAGSMENFIAALDAGADAIYLGGKGFNARAHAANFDIDLLEEAVRLAHIKGTAVYVTVNILIGDSEMKELAAYLKELERVGVDAILVQDLAVAELAQKVAPKLHLHGSTQMTAMNLETVRFYESIGFTRVVLGREVSLEDIRHICANCKAEIEVFVHGALCVCYSGQCQMSSFIGGRSGNRGSCAQPCRLPYELLDEKGNVVPTGGAQYLLSPKDLNYSEFIGELIDAGVTSFKVEGRMKKVSYVKEVISSYRRILDAHGKVTDKDRKSIASVFNRGFSTAHLENLQGRDMITAVVPNNKHTQSIANDAKSRGLSEFEHKIPLYAYLTIEEGPHTALMLMTEDGRSVTVTHEFEPVLAQKKPTSMEKVQDQLGRLGNTLFRLESVSIPDGDYMWPASVLNELRRTGIEAMEDLLIADHIAEQEAEVAAHTNLDLTVKDAVSIYQEAASERKAQQEAWVKAMMDGQEAIISARVDELPLVQAAIKGGAQKIIFGGDRLYRLPYQEAIYKEVVDLCRQYKVWVTLSTPRIVKDAEVEGYHETLQAMVAAKPDAIAIHAPGHVVALRDLGYQGALEADTALNIFNSHSARFWEHQGVVSLAPSQELTLQQLGKIAKETHVPVEATVQGLVEMMISEYCVIGAFVGGGLKKTCTRPCLKQSYSLKDRKGEIFPLRTDPYCRMHIMNSHELDMRAYVPDLIHKGISILRIDGRQWEPKRLEKMVRQYKDIASGRQEPPAKKTEDNKAITRGHYFRGIL
ncbi:MAG: U32 family peptidase [Veillonella sp.]|nr:U32 family peptidase [Veillonella sp.]